MQVYIQCCLLLDPRHWTLFCHWDTTFVVNKKRNSSNEFLLLHHDRLFVAIAAVSSAGKNAKPAASPSRVVVANMAKCVGISMPQQRVLVVVGLAVSVGAVARTAASPSVVIILVVASLLLLLLVCGEIRSTMINRVTLSGAASRHCSDDDDGIEESGDACFAVSAAAAAAL